MSILIASSDVTVTYEAPVAGYLYTSGKYYENYKVDSPKNFFQEINIPGVDGSTVINQGFRSLLILLQVIYVGTSEATVFQDACADALAISSATVDVTINNVKFPYCILLTSSNLGCPKECIGESTSYYLPQTLILESKRLD